MSRSNNRNRIESTVKFFGCKFRKKKKKIFAIQIIKIISSKISDLEDDNGGDGDGNGEEMKFKLD